MKKKISVALLLFAAVFCLFAKQVVKTDEYPIVTFDMIEWKPDSSVETDIFPLETEDTINSLVLKITPYGRQFVSTSLNTKHKSDYGFGFSAGYRRSVLDISPFKVLVGGDIAYKAYTYSKDRTPAHLGNLQFLAKAGCVYNLMQYVDIPVGIEANIGMGLEIDFSRLATNANFVFETDLNGTYKLNQKYTVLAGLEFSVTAPDSKDSEYKATALNLNLLIGAQMNF